MALVPGVVWSHLEHLHLCWGSGILGGPRAHALRMGLERASLQLAQGLRRKNKPCRKEKKTMKKKEKCAVILKSPFPIADLYLCWKGLRSPRAAVLVAASLSGGAVSGRPGPFSPSFVRQVVSAHVLCLCQVLSWAWGAAQSPDLPHRTQTSMGGGQLTRQLQVRAEGCRG